MRASVVVVTWNGREHLQTLLPALRPLVPAHEVVVVDNGSHDGTGEFVANSYPDFTLVRNDHNAGFAAGVNRGVEAADGDVAVFLNNDAVPLPNWLEELILPIESGEAEVCGGRILDWEGKTLSFGEGLLTFDGHAFQKNVGAAVSEMPLPDPQYSLFASGGNMAVRRDRFLELGGFDPDYFAYFEDVDFGWRANLAGDRVLLIPGGVVRHQGAGTSGRLDPFDRGFLFEVNAFQTVVKNLGEAELKEFLPAVLLTLLSRLQSLTVRLADESGLLDRFPFSPEGYRPSRTGGGMLSRLAGRRETLELTHPHSISYARSIQYILENLDRILEKRRSVQALRRVECSDVLSRIEVAAVPTYPGDEQLFQTAFFRYVRPALVTDRTLDDIQNASPYG